MSFEKFGKISYTKETKVADFVEYLEEGRIMATKCRKCGKLYFPARADCVACLTNDMAWVEMSGKGKLITYTIAYFAPAGFEGDSPYVLALAELEEGVRVFARLSRDVREDEIVIGMGMKLVPMRLPNNKITYELRKI